MEAILKRLTLFILLSIRAFATEWYVSPSGTAGSAGTKASPWSIEHGWTNSPMVVAGDTVWLRGGTYGVGSNVFNVTLTGSSGNPITLRAYPGERAIINGGINASSVGGWTTFWGFEITCSNSRTNIYANRPAGLVMDGVGHKAINLVIYDSGHPGIGTFQNEGTGREIYGCVIWGVGLYEYDNVTTFPTNTVMRGAGIYAQNRYNTFSISDTISGRALNGGMKAYAQDGYASGFIFDGNITLQNGLAGIEVEVINNSISNCTVINNYDYRSFRNTMGYFDNDDLAPHYGLFYSNNYQVVYPGYRQGALWLQRWRSVQVLGNTVITAALSNEWRAATGNATGYESGGNFVELNLNTNAPVSYTINSNSYHGGVELGPTYRPFRYEVFEPELTFNEWTNTHGFDLNSSYTTNLPTVNVVVLRTNKYERGRAHIAVFNWQSNSTVSVNLSSAGLNNGQRFEVRDVQNYLGTPVLLTNYNVAQPTIILPLTLTSVMELADHPATHTASLFNTFVLLPVTRRTLNAGTLTVGGGGQ